MSRREQRIVEQVSDRLDGKLSRHERAERRRDIICGTMDRNVGAGRIFGFKQDAYRYLAQMYGVSPSTIRLIHKQHCRLKPPTSRGASK